MDWQPPENAPRDKTPVLAQFDLCLVEQYCVFTVRWNQEYNGYEGGWMLSHPNDHEVHIAINAKMLAWSEVPIYE